MDYKKAYKEALERAKKVHKYSSDIAEIKRMEDIFPELAESDDKKIREAQLDYWRSVGGKEWHGVPVQETIAWLEKQGKQASAIRWYDTSLTPEEMMELLVEWETNDATWHEVAFYHADTKTFWDGERQVENVTRWCYIDDILEKQGDTNETINSDEFAQDVLRGAAINLITWIDYNAAEGNMCLSNTECKDIEDALVSGDWNKIYAYMKKKLERQDEQKSIFDFNANNWCVSKVDGKVHNIYNSGVESKFHEGDWVVWQDKCYKVNYNGCRYELIDQNGLSTSLEYETVDENAHLWTIQDAKNGDIVVDKSDGTIGIFESIGHHPDGGSFNDPSYCFLHCRYDDGDFYADFEGGNIMDSYDAIPATKEQRDNLFEKMHEEGYEWEEEKKELKKIEEEYNGDDYGIDSLFHAQRILEKTLGKVDGYQTDDGILSHKCAITAVKKLYEQKSEWSEEGEHRLKDTIYFLDTAKKHYASTVEIDACINWLKSIKQ